MISFRFKNNTKRVKIKTHQKLDERMSHWLQKVFNFKTQIIGFKSQDNKFYDIQSFYANIEKFFGMNVDIIQSSDQLEISFTSQNLNSSSFLRPNYSQQNTSEINHKGPSSDQIQDFNFVTDLKSFQKKLLDGKDISILFDVNAIYRNTLSDNSSELANMNIYNNFKVNLFMYINNSHPKKSCFSIYIGKTFVITMPLTTNYCSSINQVINRYKNSSILAERQNKLFLQNRASHQQEDQAPSFTTYHLQERLNQEACLDYLHKMNKEKLLRNYQYHKLIQKCEQNFSQFYRIFCQGIMDNDYQSFRNQLLVKVENNLQLILSNVDQMDLSRPISRQEQRRYNLKKSVPQIQIVKVQNYFQILDQLTDLIDSNYLNEVKQYLLDQNQDLCGFFARYLARQINQQELAKNINQFVKKTYDERPISRCLPRINKSKSADPRRKFSQQRGIFGDGQQLNLYNPIQEPPMFGSIPQQQNFSPIRYADIQNVYKQTWDNLSDKAQLFQPQQYGLLYYYLQKRDGTISNEIQNLDFSDNNSSSFNQLRQFLNSKIQTILKESLNISEYDYLETVRDSHSIKCIFQNFRYQSDLNNFLRSLKEELHKLKPNLQAKILHKKSSDSQLLQNRQTRSKRFGQRKYSDQNEQNVDPRSPSPKDSQISLYNRPRQYPNLLQSISQQWGQQFQEMLKDINLTEEKKQNIIRDLFKSGSGKVFTWIRNYVKGQAQFFSNEELKNIQGKQQQLKFILSLYPIFQQFLRLYVEQGLITDKVRKWLISQYYQTNMSVIGALQFYLQTKQEQEFVDTLKLIYQIQNKDMEFYNNYIKRLQHMLKEMAIHDQIGMEVFQYFPTQIKAICQLYYITGDLEDMLDTLDVIYQKQSELRRINSATLNFSGINLNPFQYHDGSDELVELDVIFNTKQQKLKPNLKFDFASKIDKNYNDSRQTIALGSFALNSQGKLPNYQQFSTIWKSMYQQRSKNQANWIKDDETIQHALDFDFILYLSVAQYVYKIQNIQEKTAQLDSKPLIEYIEQKRSRPSSKIQVKQQMVMNYLLKSSIDVLFLQQASGVDWGEELINQYTWYKHSDSVIIFRKDKFGHMRKDLMATYSDILNFNNDTVCVFTDKNYLLISAHLKSSKLNIEQAKDMFQKLQKVLSDHPLLKLILGIDANHFIERSPQTLELNIVPSVPEKPTSVKKRTSMQVQAKKANVQVQEVKDHLMTNKKIHQSRIERIDGQQADRQNLPNYLHPYDHFIVRATIS